MKPISLTRYLNPEQHAGRINADLRLLIEVVARACKSISIAVGKGALGGVLGDALSAGEASINVQGEAQKKLDVLSNEILLEANAWGGHLAGIADEVRFPRLACARAVARIFGEDHPIAQRHHTPHPQTFALGGCNLVAYALAGHFALELSK